MAYLQLPTASQDYLKVIWKGQEWSQGPISSRALAERLGFAPSTVSETLKKLREQGLLANQPYGAIELTTEGTAAAVAMVRRHRLIETFLVDYLGYGWDEVHDEAEVLEHAVSDTFVERLFERLGEPQRDPHGDPIPGRAGTFPQIEAYRLYELTAGSQAIITRVSDDDPQLLRYLSEQSVKLDSYIYLIGHHPYAGTVTVELDGVTRELGIPAANAIWVTLVDGHGTPQEHG